MVDLGAAKNINRVILKWHTDYAKAFQIQVSANSSTWTDVYSTTKGASYSVTDVTTLRIHGLGAVCAIRTGDWLSAARPTDIRCWGTEPDGAHFVPPSWNRPVIVEPAYNAPIWKASLFQGGGNAVKNIQSSSLKNPYSVIYGRGRISVFAQRPLIGQCVLLDGKVIKTFTLDRGRRIDLSRSIGSGNVYILRLGSRAGDFSRSEMVFPF
jgi:hypothetical protein